MDILRIWTDETGQSHFGRHPWPLLRQDYCASPSGYEITDALPAGQVRLIRTPAGFVDDWHPVPDPLLCVLLTGRLKVEVGDGAVEHMKSGDMIFCDDIAGKGHRMTETSGGAYDMLLVAVDGGGR